MSEIRVSVALHFTFNPAKELAKIPAEITKTVAVGDEVQPTKVPGDKALQGATRDALLALMEKEVIKAQKTAKPAAKKPESKPAEKKEETSDQPSLL